MKHLFSFLGLIFCCSILCSQNTWTVINTGYNVDCTTNFDVQDKSIYLLNTQHSTLLRSFDKGLTWDSVLVPSSNPTAHYYSVIHFLNDSVGFIAGYDGGPYLPGGITSLVKKTTDRGATWQTITSGLSKNAHLTNLNFFDNDTGFVFGTGFGKVDRFKTVDGGQNWSFIPDQTTPYELDLGIIDYSGFFGSQGFVTGFASSFTNAFRVGVTSNKGTLWTTNKFPSNASARCARFLSGTSGVIAVEDSIHFTTDGAVTFSAKHFPYSSVIRAFDMVDMQHGYFLTDHAIYYTADGASTFSLSYQDSTRILGQVRAVGNDVFVSTCHGKEILKFNLQGTVITNLANSEGLIVSVYPSPGKDLLTINCNSSIASVKIFNVAGQLLIENIEASGTSKVLAHRLTPGIYMVQISTQSGEIMRKVVVED